MNTIRDTEVTKQTKEKIITFKGYIETLEDWVAQLIKGYEQKITKNKIQETLKVSKKIYLVLNEWEEN